jgi:8-oxo-dGTP pyrophosphatase MutT (NUDIX family)
MQPVLALLPEEMLIGNQNSLPTSVKGVLFRRINGSAEVLLLRNDRNEWELPGGRPEAGETPEECLSREIREETGLVVGVGPCIHSGVLTILPPHVPNATNVLISAYGCHLKSPADTNASIALSDEHKAAAWIRVEDLADLSDVPEIYKAAVQSGKRKIDQLSQGIESSRNEPRRGGRW